MKKRKPPVILASIIVVLISAIFVVAWPRKSSEQQLAMQDQLQEMKLTGESRETMSEEQMKMAATKSSESVETNMDPAAVDRTRPRRPKKPSIFVEEMVVSKPTPNDSSVSSQWYRPESEKN